MPNWEWFSSLAERTRSSEVLAAVAVLSACMLLASVVAIPWLLCRLPEDYLNPEALSVAPGLGRRVLRNVLGVLLLLMGLLMLVLPGQGLLTIVAGLTLLDFPKKRQLLAKVLGRPRVLRVINSIRQRFGHPPLARVSSKGSVELQ